MTAESVFSKAAKLVKAQLGTFSLDVAASLVIGTFTLDVASITRLAATALWAIAAVVADHVQSAAAAQRWAMSVLDHEEKVFPAPEQLEKAFPAVRARAVAHTTASLCVTCAAQPLATMLLRYHGFANDPATTYNEAKLCLHSISALLRYKTPHWNKIAGRVLRGTHVRISATLVSLLLLQRMALAGGGVAALQYVLGRLKDVTDAYKQLREPEPTWWRRGKSKLSRAVGLDECARYTGRVAPVLERVLNDTATIAKRAFRTAEARDQRVRGAVA